MDFFIVYGLVIISFIITLGAQMFVEGSYKLFKKGHIEKGLTGLQVARYMLDNNGLSDVKVEEVSGHLSDHYDPRDKTVRLSSDNYRGDSIASVSVACHECGHALQDKEGYLFMRIRHSLVPIVNFSSYAGYIAITIGLLFGATSFVWLGILLEIIILLFQLVTLPVEFNASKRALKVLENDSLLVGKELGKGKVMLGAAAMTYVASVAATLIQILRLILMFRRRND